jgi:hypothetical protein
MQGARRTDMDEIEGWLDELGDRIEVVCAEHSAPVRVTGGNVLPDCVQLNARLGKGRNPNNIRALSREIADRLGKQVRIYTIGSVDVMIEVEREGEAAETVRQARQNALAEIEEQVRKYGEGNRDATSHIFGADWSSVVGLRAG